MASSLLSLPRRVITFLVTSSLNQLASSMYGRLKNFPKENKARVYYKNIKEMASQQQREELEARARQGETVVPGGTGAKSLEAQAHLVEGRSRGGQTRKEQLGTEGYQEMGRKGGLSTADKSGGEREAEEGIEIDESKFKTRS